MFWIFKKFGVVVTLVLFIDFQWNTTFLFWLGLFDWFFGQGMGGGGWKGKKGFHLALSATIIQEDQLSYIQTLSSDFVTNSYGASWDSSCEKSWVPVQNQWVPVKKKRVRNWMLGPLCDQTVNLKTDSKTLYYSALQLKYSPSVLKHNKGKKKYESLNSSHNNFHRNYTNGMFLQIQNFRSIYGSCVLQNTYIMNYFAYLRILCVRNAGCRGNKITAWGGGEGRVHSSKAWHRVRVSILKSCNRRQN